MAGARAYPFSLIAGLLALSFLLGLGVGTLITHRMYQKTAMQELSALLQAQGANTIMDKRMQAIKQALKEGKTEYQFEVEYAPPLSGGK